MSSLILNPSGKNVITCNLCQQRIVEAPPLNIPATGQLPKSASKIQDLLQKHLMKHHEKEVMQAIAIAQGFLPFLVWNAFTHEDPSVPPMVEAIRAPLFAMVRKNSFTDKSLQHIVAGFGLDPDDAAKVLQGMIAVRDACCEFNQFGPTAPQETAIHRV